MALKKVSRTKYFNSTSNMKNFEKIETDTFTSWIDKNGKCVAKTVKDENGKNEFFLL